MLTSNFTVTYRVPGDLKQTDHIDGLPLGTRGGILVHHNFPLDAEYDFKIRARGGGIGVGGVGVKGEELELTLNGERVKIATGTSLRSARESEGRAANRRRGVYQTEPPGRGRSLADLRRPVPSFRTS